MSLEAEWPLDTNMAPDNGPDSKYLRGLQWDQEPEAWISTHVILRPPPVGHPRVFGVATWVMDVRIDLGCQRPRYGYGQQLRPGHHSDPSGKQATSISQFLTILASSDLLLTTAHEPFCLSFSLVSPPYACSS